ncbi:MAG: endonuclease III [Alphaproteobacteria bacterium]
MTKANIHAFFSNLRDADPEPQGELNYTNPYTLVVAVALSAQATDIGVNKATKDLFKIVKTPEDMLKLGEAKLIDHIKSIGLYKTKAKNVMKAAQLLVDEFGSQVPENRDDLEKLPGVGRKTANVVLNIAFGHSTIAVDTHLFRVSNRTGLAPGSTPLAVEKKLLKKVPDEFMRHAHHWLILHGRYVCKARKPECDKCVVVDQCLFKGKLINS